jgi:DNA-binding transcriptional ArsR family regulator
MDGTTDPKSPAPRLSGRARLLALQALASPIRQEIVSELAEGVGTVKELSARLGRSRQALHHHVGILERAGLVEVDSFRGEGRSRERVYRLVRSRTDLRAKALTPGERNAATKAATALLRLTERELIAAMRRRGPGSSPDEPPIMALRAKARLDAAGTSRLQELLQEITALFSAARGRNRDCRFVALTVTLAPARVSASKSHRRTTKT